MILLEPGAVIAAGYRLERPLARGGMGSVWVARHLRLDVDVAIKFMAPEYAASAEARARFEREAKASAQLRSPHVVQVHDYGVDGDTPYIVMELLEGEDLDTRLRRVKRLSLPETRVVLEKVCRALARAHEVGLVHRDLKPGNVFLARVGREETVKILDFGIAKSMDPALAGNATKTGTLLGSPYYMSPEQMRRSKLVDHRSDLWSIGVVVYQCVVGRLPFSGEELVDVLVEICTEPIPPPSFFAPDLPPAFDGFIERALARDVSQRFQSAGELADAFAAIAMGAPPPHPGSALIAGHPQVPGAAPPPSLPDVVPVSAAVPLPSSTLAPAGHTFASPPRQGRRIGLMVGVVSVAAAAGVTLSLLIFRAPSPAQRSGVASGEPSSAPNPATMGEAPPPPLAAPAAPSSSAPVATESPASAPSSTAGLPAHPPSGSPHPPAVKGASKRNANDPLDSR